MMIMGTGVMPIGLVASIMRGEAVDHDRDEVRFAEEAHEEAKRHERRLTPPPPRSVALHWFIKRGDGDRYVAAQEARRHAERNLAAAREWFAARWLDVPQA